MSWLGKDIRRPSGGLAQALARMGWRASMGVALDLWAPPRRHRGHARAQSKHGGLAFLAGSGVERDPNKAVDWLKRAAEQGDAGGQRKSGTLLLRRLGACPQDQAEAARWYEKAARAGRWPTPRICCRG